MTTYRVFQINGNGQRVGLGLKIDELDHQREAYWHYRCKNPGKQTRHIIVELLTHGGRVADWWEYDLEGEPISKSMEELTT
jgi:D-alanyl-D-alanine dipeptidase